MSETEPSAPLPERVSDGKGGWLPPLPPSAHPPGAVDLAVAECRARHVDQSAPSLIALSLRAERAESALAAATERATRAERALASVTEERERLLERYPCDGLCRDHAEEDCSRHGRTPADLWSIINDFAQQRNQARAQVAKMRAIHVEWVEPTKDDPWSWCRTCEKRWPCPTIRALDSHHRGHSRHEPGRPGRADRGRGGV